ncbi:MAG: polysaccharide biosynthesis/export family protein [Sedimentisphaerales bacterium]|nr:polysaccharide biosynthesis/export family protein [Sedimentisphaerales bacterium]
MKVDFLRNVLRKESIEQLIPMEKRFLLLSVSVILISGCGNKFFDPTQIGRFRPVPAVNVILDSLGVAEETPSAWKGAEEPKPVDIMAYETDYVFNPADSVRVQIFELRREGETYVNDFVVSETGKISIPYVGVVEASGLTESQLEEEIRQLLEPSILKDPLLTVTLLSSQQRAFSILGEGVLRPNRYVVPRYDFRLSDALAIAGGISQFNVTYIYVSRSVTGQEAITETVEELKPAKPQEIVPPEQELLEVIAPRARAVSYLETIVSSAEMATEQEIAEAEKEQLVDEAGQIEWVFQDGRWVPVQVGRTEVPEPEIKPEKEVEPLKEEIPRDLAWEQIGTGGVQRRVIKIPVDSFLGGDPRYDIIIRPGDTVNVPVDIIGEFCIMGNVNNTGFIPITGRPMTLKMAIAAAGGLGPLAWPKSCEIVRRIGKNKEEIVMVDLDKIARGEQPDFYIKPNDLINVGTHSTARWRAVLRNAFRATYGFGFIYDRNFADRDYGTSRPIPDWF